MGQSERPSQEGRHEVSLSDKSGRLRRECTAREQHERNGWLRGRGRLAGRHDPPYMAIPTSRDALGASVRQREQHERNGWLRGRGRLAGRHDPPYMAIPTSRNAFGASVRERRQHEGKGCGCGSTG